MSSQTFIVQCKAFSSILFIIPLLFSLFEVLMISSQHNPLHFCFSLSFLTVAACFPFLTLCFGDGILLKYLYIS